MIVLLNSRLSRVNIVNTSSAAAASKFPVGSSAKIKSGSVTIARAILNRLRFSNEDCTQIIALVQHHMQFGDIMQMRRSTLKRFLRLPKFDEHLALHYADVMSSNRQTELYEFAKQHRCLQGF